MTSTVPTLSPASKPNVTVDGSNRSVSDHGAQGTFV